MNDFRCVGKLHAEKKVTDRVRRETDDSSQIFIPFINDVRVGCPESSSSASVDLEESNVSMSGSPPSLPPPSLPVPPPGKLTPPSSPNVGQPAREGWEPVELQLDYWGKQTQGEKGKSTLRQAFRALHVQRLPPLGEAPGHHLSMNYTMKEKKQKSKTNIATVISFSLFLNSPSLLFFLFLRNHC